MNVLRTCVRRVRERGIPSSACVACAPSTPRSTPHLELNSPGPTLTSPLLTPSSVAEDVYVVNGTINGVKDIRLERQYRRNLGVCGGKGEGEACDEAFVGGGGVADEEDAGPQGGVDGVGGEVDCGGDGGED